MRDGQRSALQIREAREGPGLTRATDTARGALSILILAAGASSRMRGGDKMLESVDGVALIRRLAMAAAKTGQQVFVTLPPDRPARSIALAGLAVRQIVVADASLGMSASIRAGVTAMPEGAVMILPGDMPEITAEDLQTMIAASRRTPDLILRATSDAGVAGHPVIFPPRDRPYLLTLSGDAGARGLLAQASDRTRHLALPDGRAVVDLDTPEEWASWRARRSTRQREDPQ